MPAAYFLPGQLWQGPDLNSGHRLQSVEPYETEGSVTRFECDPDTDITGDVAFLQVRDATTKNIAATQKVRLLASPEQAATLRRRHGPGDGRLPGPPARPGPEGRRVGSRRARPRPPPNATVEPQAPSSVDDATGLGAGLPHHHRLRHRRELRAHASGSCSPARARP